MDEVDRSEFLIALDDELLKGGVILSEWCSFIVCECDAAFIAGANLAAIVTAMAGIETYLVEYPLGERANLFDLVKQSPLADDLKREIDVLRKSNRWVHVADPENDQDLLDHPEQSASSLRVLRDQAVRTLRRTIYENQLV